MRVQEEDEKKILESLKDDSFDLRRKIILEEDVPDKIKSKLKNVKEDDLSHAKITKYDVNRVEIVADMKSPGFLVLSDTYYPGWKAYVNGKQKKIFIADYTLRAVFLDKGRHIVEFVYEPLLFKLGSWISILTFIFIIGVLSRKMCKSIFKVGNFKNSNQ